MARNKYPQETIDKIVTVSSRLFVEKGYENTSIQDIIDGLGGLTKGAIYHHFKSKEEIMLAVMERQTYRHEEMWMQALRDDEKMTGLEKLQRIFQASVDNPRQNDLFQSAPNFLNNPKMLSLQLKSIKEESAPKWIEPIIREAIEDGSIKTDYPKEMAEVILLLLNIWVTPMVYAGAPEEIRSRVAFFGELMKRMGVDLVTPELADRFHDLTDLYYIHDTKK